MKNFISGIALVLIVALAVFLIVWSLPTTTTPIFSGDKSIPDNEIFISTDEATSNASSVIPDNGVYLFDTYIDLLKTGVYKQTITKQRQIGGYSIPVTTVTYFGKNFINVTEHEMHNVATETFINKTGAYYFNEDYTEATLMPTDSVTLQSFPWKNLKYQSSGSTVLGLYDYTYERYLTQEGATVDYLFLNGKLKKMKLYSNPEKDEYTIIGLEISEDISSARTALPYGIKITDLR